MQKFTKNELAQYNGKDGAPAFIAYEGKVYDVSHSFLWQDGRHQVLHTAGVDLTFAGKMSCDWNALQRLKNLYVELLS
jgi:predicted heme/steroid binding protein